MISAIEMTHTDYMACHKDYRRLVRGRKELLVFDRVTGRQTWVPVQIVQKAKGADLAPAASEGR